MLSIRSMKGTSMTTKTATELFNEFKQMTLSKQTLIAVATITLVVTFLANYKEIKAGTKELVSNFTQNENIQEFMDDVKNLLQSFTKTCKNFVKAPIKIVQDEQEIIND